MAKRGKKLDPFLYKGKRLSSARQEYNKELIRLYRRAQEWKRKYGFEIELPELPKAATKKSIEAVKSIRWSDLTDVDRLQAEYAKKHPEIDFIEAAKYKYQGQALLEVSKHHYITKEDVTRHPELYDSWVEQETKIDLAIKRVSVDDFTEEEWVNTGGEGCKPNKKDIPRTEPVVTEQEMDAFLNDLIEECCYYWDKVYTHSNYWSYRHNMQLAEEYSQKIRLAFNDLLNQSNKKKVYEYLSRPEVTAKLREDVNNLYGKESDDRNGTGHEYYFMRLLDTLNGGPLTDEQMQQYQEYGTFDFSNFDEYD